MIIIMKPRATEAQTKKVISKIESIGLRPVQSKGEERTIVAVIGDERKLEVQPIAAYSGVERILPVQHPFKMVSREHRTKSSVITIGKNIKIGDKRVVLMAGPCTVESYTRLNSIASKVKTSGVKILRGGAFKPRTSPYDFQGLGEQGLKYLQKVKKETGLLIVSELMDVRDAELFSRYVDVVQIGARNMQNFNLLKEVGKIRKPVLLKRGISSTINEFLMAAEYVFSHGNHNIILCERGIRTFDQTMRFTLDLGAVSVLKNLCHLPVVVDPSHPSGNRKYVPSLAKAAIAAGADGLLIEVHDKPEIAMCDGPQAMLPKDFNQLVKELRRICKAIGRIL